MIAIIHYIERPLRAHGIFAILLLTWLGTLIGAASSDTLLAWSCGLVYVCYDTWLIAYVAWKTRDLTAPRNERAALTLPHTDARPTLGVVVPARNEESAIVATIDGLLKQTDVPDRIIVVNDGSTDRTAAVLEQAFDLSTTGEGLWRSPRYPMLHVLHKPNTGKADSLNEALTLIHTDLIVTVDADTELAADALAAVRRAFAREPALAAACGILAPRCTGGFSARAFGWFQSFEYLRAFLSRAAWMQSNALLLISGAFAAYRRDAVAAIGGYDAGSLVEDYELIHRLHRYASDHGLDWRVRVLPEAVASTDAPATLRALLHQRRRWFSGFLRTQFEYRAMLGKRHYGAVGRFMLPIKSVDTLQPVYGLTAVTLLVTFLVTGASVARAVITVIVIKLAIDLCFHLWAVKTYYGWLKLDRPKGIWLHAVLCSIAEPFSFQLARHCGALWGWLLVLAPQKSWLPQRKYYSRETFNGT